MRRVGQAESNLIRVAICLHGWAHRSNDIIFRSLKPKHPTGDADQKRIRPARPQGRHPFGAFRSRRERRGRFRSGCGGSPSRLTFQWVSRACRRPSRSSSDDRVCCIRKLNPPNSTPVGGCHNKSPTGRRRWGWVWFQMFVKVSGSVSCSAELRRRNRKRESPLSPVRGSYGVQLQRFPDCLATGC